MPGMDTTPATNGRPQAAIILSNGPFPFRPWNVFHEGKRYRAWRDPTPGCERSGGAPRGYVAAENATAGSPLRRGLTHTVGRTGTHRMPPVVRRAPCAVRRAPCAVRRAPCVVRRAPCAAIIPATVRFLFLHGMHSAQESATARCPTGCRLGEREGACARPQVHPALNRPARSAPRAPRSRPRPPVYAATPHPPRASSSTPSPPARSS